MASPTSLAAIAAAERVLLAHADEIAAACAMAHPTVVVGVVPNPEDDAVRVHHVTRGILPAIAAYEGLGTLIIDPRAHRTLADVRTRIQVWATWRRGILQDDAWPVVPSASSGPDDPPSPAG